MFKYKSKAKIIVVVVILAMGIFFISKNSQIRDRDFASIEPAIGQKTISEKKIRPLVEDPLILKSSEALLSKAPDTSKLAETSLMYFKDWMKDSNFRLFFSHTLKFFGPTKAGFAAARFVSLTMVFDENPEMFYLMKWTKKDIFSYSSELMATLESKKDQIGINPYFESRMLNLVFQLNVQKERKLSFFTEVLDRELQLTADGNLKDESLAFETALVLAKNANISPNELAPVIGHVISINSSPMQEHAVRDRVLNYYPELKFMFKIAKN